MCMLLWLLFVNSAESLRFNQISASLDPLETVEVETGRRRRRKTDIDDDTAADAAAAGTSAAGTAWDSDRVQYILRFNGAVKAAVTVVETATFRTAIITDVASCIVTAFAFYNQLNGETSQTITAKLTAADALKVETWEIAESSSQFSKVGAPTFHKLVSWPENPEWTVVGDLAPAVFDQLFKAKTFRDCLDTALIATDFSGYVAAGGDYEGDSLVERTYSHTEMIGDLHTEASFIAPGGGFTTATATNLATLYGLQWKQALQSALAGVFSLTADDVNIGTSVVADKFCTFDWAMGVKVKSTAADVANNKILLAVLNSEAAVKSKFARAAADYFEMHVSFFTTTGVTCNEADVNAPAVNTICVVQMQYKSPCSVVGDREPKLITDAMQGAGATLGQYRAKQKLHIPKILTLAAGAVACVGTGLATAEKTVTFGEGATAAFTSAAIGGDNGVRDLTDMVPDKFPEFNNAAPANDRVVFTPMQTGTNTANNNHVVTYTVNIKNDVNDAARTVILAAKAIATAARKDDAVWTAVNTAAQSTALTDRGITVSKITGSFVGTHTRG